jgi:RNA polymerase sigma-70 factor (sigma-E family)
MAAGRSTAELERFLGERADHLLRTAVLLAGNREAGEDLLQTAVERLLRRWGRIDGDPEGYVRRTLCNLAIDGYRRAGRWRQKERLLRTELRQPQDATGDVDLRDALVRLLLQLPARQRAALVLRYREQLTDAEAAAVLGCSEGTVKSSGSRGLARLREQDSDVVILLHREDAYEQESPRAGEADLIIAKHRNGPTATVTVAFQGHYSRFVDMAPG